MHVHCVFLIKQGPTFIIIIFVTIQIFHFKLFTPLECKYNKQQFGIRISAIEASKQKLRISMSLYACNKTYSKKNIQEHVHSQEREDTQWFHVSISACAAFILLRRRRDSRKSIKGQKKPFKTAAAIVSFFAFFKLYSYLLKKKSTEQVQVISPPPGPPVFPVFSLYGSFIIIIIIIILLTMSEFLDMSTWQSMHMLFGKCLLHWWF